MSTVKKIAAALGLVAVLGVATPVTAAVADTGAHPNSCASHSICSWW